MELDELKKAWIQYDKKLSENLKINQELLKKITLGKSKHEMKLPKNYEIASVVIGGLFILYFGVQTCMNISEMKFFIPGIIAILISILLVIGSIIKLNILSKMDYNNSSLVELQKMINLFKQRAMLYRKIEYYSFPIFIITFFPIGLKAIRNIDYTSFNNQRLLVGLIMAIIIYYPFAIWFYKSGYDRKIKSATDFLSDLNKFVEE